ncbi:MAG TPA: hypothetical protein VMU54_14625 [Planctomycetota bacterium]|nr:hypothetical protein [Planctomycetota bacterium]
MGSMRWVFILAMVAGAAGSGCVGPATFNEADQQGPAAECRGGWTDETSGWMFVFGQNGETVTVTDPWAQSMAGKVKGRVFLSDDLHNAITVAPDGASAEWNYGGTAHFRTLRKVVVGPSSRHPRTKNDPVLGGWTICQLPVGATGMPFQAGPVRECLVLLQVNHEVGWEGYGALPLDPPRQFGWKAVNEATFFDRAEFIRTALGSALSKPQPGSVEGRPCWWSVFAGWWNNLDPFRPNVMVAGLYFADPMTGVRPEAYVWVATREPGKDWVPVPDWPRYGVQKLTRVTSVVGKDPLFKVEAAEDPEPPLWPFLRVPETSIHDARWHTNGLVAVKNRTIPKMLRDMGTPELKALIEQLEKHVLDLNHESELCRDQAQKKVEKSAQTAQEIRDSKREMAQIQTQLQDQDLDPNIRNGLLGRFQQLQGTLTAGEQQEKASETEVDHLREMSIIYKERTEVLKPMLAAIKEEIANRGK